MLMLNAVTPITICYRKFGGALEKTGIESVWIAPKWNINFVAMVSNASCF